MLIWSTVLTMTRRVSIGNGILSLGTSDWAVSRASDGAYCSEVSETPRFGVFQQTRATVARLVAG